jgi:ketosteroid isomerase-like protein
MTSNVDTVKRLNAACQAKDFRMVESVLHPDFKFKDPTMTLNNPKEYLEFMQNCPFDGKLENATFIESGDKVVQILDCKMTKPSAFTMHMCDVLTFRDGKLVGEEVFFDTAQIPEEAKNIAEKAMQNKKAA